METYLNLYPEFRCIGERCRRNCCMGWSITLDSETTAYYHSLKDEYGRFLQKKFEGREDGSAVFPLSCGEACPAQDEQGLCEVFKRYGEDKMSHTCKTYPRHNVLTSPPDCAYHILVPTCEEVLREVDACKSDLEVELNILDEGEIDRHPLVYSMVQYNAWGISCIQNRDLPLSVSISAVMQTGISLAPKAAAGDVEAVREVLARGESVVRGQMGIASAIHEEDVPEIWELITRIVFEYLELLNKSKYNVYHELMPAAEKIDIEDGEHRGVQLVRAFYDSVEWLDPQKDFIYRFPAYLFSAESFTALSEVGSYRFLYEWMPWIIITTVLPCTWSDEVLKEREEYLSRLALLQRTKSGEFYTQEFVEKLRKTMEYGVREYAKMYALLFDIRPEQTSDWYQRDYADRLVIEYEPTIYIGAPACAVTGGPTLAHQMCHELRGEGLPTKMYYYSRNKVFAEWTGFADSPYAKYDTEVAGSLKEIDRPENVVILGETAMPVRFAFFRAQVHVWWMSVNNYLYTLINHEEYLEKDLAFFKQKNVKHFVQSRYAHDFLINDMQIPEEQIIYLTDYIDEDYLHEEGFFGTDRENIVYYNKKKVGDILPGIMEEHPEITWVPIINMTRDQIIEAFLKGKVYVDFGAHPGKDRIPREAASCGLCVITNRDGAAANSTDVPIGEEYKFNDLANQKEEFINRIRSCFEEYDVRVKDFAGYREWIRGEKDRFHEEALRVADILLKRQ